MKKLLCKFLGHKWDFSDNDNVQICTRCCIVVPTIKALKTYLRTDAFLEEFRKGMIKNILSESPFYIALKRKKDTKDAQSP